jgi:hypothetical protein
MSIASRITRLEAALHEGEADGCSTCRTWPDAWACLGRSMGDDNGEDAEDRVDRWAPWATTEHGHHCPSCGRQPPTYGLTLVDIISRLEPSAA